MHVKMDSIKTRVLCMSYKEICLNEICREPFIQSQVTFQSRRNFAVGQGFCFALRMGFYEYISWESKSELIFIRLSFGESLINFVF